MKNQAHTSLAYKFKLEILRKNSRVLLIVIIEVKLTSKIYPGKNESEPKESEQNWNFKL